MKILFITDLYPVNDLEKTTPRTLYNFVRDWESFGEDVKVLKPNFLLNSFIRKKPYYKTGLYGNVFNVNYITPFWGDIQKKTGNFLKENFDVVIAHMPSGILYADKLELPFIAGVHNSDIEVLTNPLYSFYFKSYLLRALRNSKAIACRSYVLKNRLLKLYPEFEHKTFVAPSGIEENAITDDIRSIDVNNLKIVTCANFKKRKNIDKLILAQKDLAEIQLTVIGDGKQRKWLEGLDNSVIFTGRLENSEVLDEMKKNDIFILPSVGETFGMVYLEAMAAGCITVCTQNDAIDGIIQNGINGFAVRPDSKSIRKLIEKIQNMSAEKLGEIRMNSINTVKKYTRTACAREYLEAIHKYIFQ